MNLVKKAIFYPFDWLMAEESGRHVDRMANLSEEEQLIFNRMKSKFPEQTDPMICRHLLRHGFNEEQTITAIEEFLAWRTPYGDVTIDDIGETAIRMGMVYTFGCSKHGVPVLIVRTGNLRLGEIASLDEVMKFNIFFIERALKATPYECYTVVFDYQGISMSNINFSWLRELLHVWNDYYPECANVEYFINMPFIFRALWGTCKPFLTERAKNAIVLCSSDYQSILLQAIDTEELQSCYGGSNPYKLPQNGELIDCFGILGSARDIQPK